MDRNVRYYGQRRVLFVPNQNFINFPSHPHFNFVPRPPIHYRNPRSYPILLPDQSVLACTEIERSVSLVQLMVDEGVVPSMEENIKRKNVVAKLKEIVKKWIKKVARNYHLNKRQTKNASATILTYGSYGLGVHNPESDIDALCVGPYYATMAYDFFILLHEMLESSKEVSDLQCIKGAKVPLMRFKFDGISVDLPYAQLQVVSVNENVNIQDPNNLGDIDESSWRALSGIRANQSILQHVPSVPHFRAMLRCVKFWAKRRGVYGHLFGFFGGVHWAILAAFINLRNPNAGLSVAIAAFFETFYNWQWPTPVALYTGFIPSTASISSIMPIQLPSSPGEYCQSNITRSTEHKIRDEFLRGHKLTKDWLRTDFDWKTLFQPFPYTSMYRNFIKLRISASDQASDQVALGNWTAWVKSRFPLLLLKLEEAQGMCDPNPTEYFDSGLQKPNIVFYWGLYSDKVNHIRIHSIEEKFNNKLRSRYEGPCGELALSIVEASQVPGDRIPGHI